MTRHELVIRCLLMLGSLNSLGSYVFLVGTLLVSLKEGGRREKEEEREGEGEGEREEEKEEEEGGREGEKEEGRRRERERGLIITYCDL